MTESSAVSAAPSTAEPSTSGPTAVAPLLTADDVARVVDRVAHQLIERAASSASPGARGLARTSCLHGGARLSPHPVVQYSASPARSRSDDSQ